MSVEVPYDGGGNCICRGVKNMAPYRFHGGWLLFQRMEILVILQNKVDTDCIIEHIVLISLEKNKPPH